ncbi:PorT family protein [Chryseobacterium sp. G0186]|uniref:outer membrane beta-barrel protein n=1 Tax=Chryseobacterium sp. G0186 TaxID=2487064 RepID=UPI000F4E9ECA|nr:outer membrane beta-barrel protein [Chryseobacterium sp. G0186]AZA78310.1 PorT family protein [Chryseobacterium sp. G0186]
MKKIFPLLFVLLSGLSFAQVTFTPGIRAGANFSHFTNDENQTFFYPGDVHYPQTTMNIKFKTRTDFYLGFLGNIRFAKFYALQPEVNYSRQGAKVESNVNNMGDQNVTVSYLGVQLVNKFYFNKFNVLVGPTLDFVVEKKNISPDNEVDLGITAGVGYDITKNFGVEARVKKGLVPVYSFYDDHTNVTFQAGVYYTFNMKK